MKRFFAAVMVLLSVVTLSGCNVLPRLKPTFWDGLTRAEARKYVQSALQEKYDEEFEVVQMGIRSGQYYRELVGTCTPKSDEKLFFEIEVNHFGESRTMIDTYIQAIVGREMKDKLNSVMSKYFSNYVLQVDVFGLSSSYDSGICSSSEASVERYTELVSDNGSIIHIILDENETWDVDGMENILKEYVPGIYKSSTSIWCYRVPKDILTECAENTNETAPGNDVIFIVSGRYPEHDFHYSGESGHLRFVGTHLCECSYCLQLDN